MAQILITDGCGVKLGSNVQKMGVIIWFTRALFDGSTCWSLFKSQLNFFGAHQLLVKSENLS